MSATLIHSRLEPLRGWRYHFILIFRVFALLVLLLKSNHSFAVTDGDHAVIANDGESEVTSVTDEFQDHHVTQLLGGTEEEVKISFSENQNGAVLIDEMTVLKGFAMTDSGSIEQRIDHPQLILEHDIITDSYAATDGNNAPETFPMSDVQSTSEEFKSNLGSEEIISGFPDNDDVHHTKDFKQHTEPELDIVEVVDRDAFRPRDGDYIVAAIDLDSYSVSLPDSPDSIMSPEEEKDGESGDKYRNRISINVDSSIEGEIFGDNVNEIDGILQIAESHIVPNGIDSHNRDYYIEGNDASKANNN